MDDVTEEQLPQSEVVPPGDSHKGGWVGRRVRRVEDADLLTGRGKFAGDIDEPGMLHAAFVRSPVPAGRIGLVDASTALELTGVVEVLTSDHLDAATDLTATLDRDGFYETPIPLLARDVVRHVGEPIAIVVARSREIAEDAVDAVRVEIDDTAAVSTFEAALDASAPRVHDSVPTNVVLQATSAGETAAPRNADVDAPDMHVSVEMSTGRLFAMPLEGRACVAGWEGPGRLVVHASTQVPFILRMALAHVLGVGESAVRVIVPEVGGGFGLKCVVGREELVTAIAAHRLRATVKWVEDRQESFVAGFHAKEQRYSVDARFSPEGRILELDAEITCDVGAYNSYPYTSAVEVLMAASQLHGPYRIPRYKVNTKGVLTNKVPMAPYRGVSRPQVVLVMETVMDKAAHQLGLDPIEVRERNLIRDADFPYTGANQVTYDRGSYTEALQLCREALDYDEWRRKQQAARNDGRLIGIGVAAFSESTAYGMSEFAARGMAITPGVENVRVRVDPSGSVLADLGTMSHGQGHRTSFAQVIADELAIPLSGIRIRQGDTDVVPFGWGSFASRSAVVSSEALVRACDVLREKILRAGAALLGCGIEDVVLDAGDVRSRAEPGRDVSIARIAYLAHYSPQAFGQLADLNLEASATYDPRGTFSNATHGCVVEIDTVTCAVQILRYVVVEDCGVVLNPLILDGQTLGGVAQGIGAALYEELVYSDDAQLLTTTLIDYLVPTAAEMPRVELHHLETPSEHGRLGVKGAGESGTIGAPAAVSNAVNDALRPLGVESTRIPITPNRLMTLLKAATVEANPA